MSSTTIGHTNKGRRVYLQGLAAVGWAVGMPYSVTYELDTIVLALDPDNGKRKVARGKGGVVDIEGRKVAQWAQRAEWCSVVYDRERGRIYIVRDDS